MNRFDPDGGYAGVSAAMLGARGEREIEVERTPQRAPRVARLRGRFCALELLPPRHAKQRSPLPVVPIAAVLVREEEPPEREDAIVWLLLSTRAVESPAPFALEDAEWKALYLHKHHLHKHRRLPPEVPPPLAEVVRWMAELGGVSKTSPLAISSPTMWAMYSPAEAGKGRRPPAEVGKEVPSLRGGGEGARRMHQSSGDAV